MHGVRLVKTPPMKTAGSARSGLDRSGNMRRKAMATSHLRTLTLSLAFPLAASGQLLGQTGQARVKPADDSVHMADMADHAMSGPMDENMMKHMRLTPARTATHDDSVRATKLVAELRQAIAKYQDTAAAVADGYKMFLPDVKNQRVYHF